MYDTVSRRRVADDGAVVDSMTAPDDNGDARAASFSFLLSNAGLQVDADDWSGRKFDVKTASLFRRLWDRHLRPLVSTSLPIPVQLSPTETQLKLPPLFDTVARSSWKSRALPCKQKFWVRNLPTTGKTTNEFLGQFKLNRSLMLLRARYASDFVAALAGRGPPRAPGPPGPPP
ncbi:hypothetical protein EVAR_94844_1 [Eumeta japonica]|uniref:Uncharacterized protein n=1 Tax=Eumeta variegata TaxID=151549 RepID=A0A4C1UIW7_EUMVA|nr:hypothetical protein EVAR_94844_1 [Eumeta japonica]